ncbi:GSCFA domain-containing protein [Hymenobacter crusticola]|uniref:GSCFA domain-containing protein n=1 Tax=Hymenobacter crusticola TaxID=1770526 RepID=A0A243WI91_9BACT|nr:GSCFA domain-containing protein [Hymenobacter crusticola]OUJ75571.1 hypothetical protein BXP70_06065 [Hymenobacter crusticola]
MFRTEIPFIAHPQLLPASARVLTVGSCFSDTIGKRLLDAKVQALVNPFGTLFNPLSACKLLRAAAGEELDWQQHLVEARGRWQSFDLHASIGADSPVDLLQHIQRLVQQTGDFLRTADVVILTLGSAFVYRLLETQELVSNCHKVPADRFDQELLTPDEIINAVAETHAFLRLQNPKLRFILTVSPVRHLKDTLPLNAVSKSVLRVACHYLSELLTDVAYFPAYELLLDDLRDYRFYAADMLHPSEVAENYIWERFTRTYFDSDFGRFQKEWMSVQQALAHRPLYPGAPEHRQFLESTLARLQRLATQADLRAEIRDVEQRLRSLPVPKPVAAPELEEDGEERIDIGQVPSEVIVPLITTDEADENTEDDEAEATEETATIVEDVQAEEAAPLPAKKKRRSRGGAKRTARKKAAQLAALAATELPLSVDSIEEASSTEPTPNAEEVHNSSDQQPEEINILALVPEVDPAPAELLEESTLQPASEPEAVGMPALAEPTTPMTATPKVRKGRTAGQILKAKSGRKSAKATVSTVPKAPRANSAPRPSRRKAPTEEPTAPIVETPLVTLPEPVPEPKPVEVPEAPTTANKRRGRPPRKSAAKTDEPTPTI